MVGSEPGTGSSWRAPRCARPPPGTGRIGPIPVERLRRSALFLAAAAFGCAAAGPGAADGFDDFAARYREASPQERPALAADFVARQGEAGGSPLIEPDGTVVFVYVGTGREESVRLIGDFRTEHHFTIAWDEVGEELVALAPGGGIYSVRLPFPPDARIDYQIVVDGEPRVDPHNRRNRESGIHGPVSELVMPEHEPPGEIERRPGVPQGRVLAVEEPWADPKVQVYLPPAYDPGRRYPVLYTADGSAWIEWFRLPTVLDNLIADGAIRPLVAVMIDPGDNRRGRYAYDPETVAYLERVIAWVDRTYSTDARPEGRVHAGTSAGGRMALYIGLERPDLAANLALFSPALHGAPSYWGPYITGEARPAESLRIWMSAGTYEAALYDDALLIEQVLRRAGLEVESVYTPEGHSFGTWRHLIPDMLRHFFGPQP